MEQRSTRKEYQNRLDEARRVVARRVQISRRWSMPRAERARQDTVDLFKVEKQKALLEKGKKHLRRYKNHLGHERRRL